MIECVSVFGTSDIAALIRRNVECCQELVLAIHASELDEAINNLRFVFLLVVFNLLEFCGGFNLKGLNSLLNFLLLLLVICITTELRRQPLLLL